MGNDLLNGKPKVINAGLEIFAKDLLENNVQALNLEWRPPGGGRMDINEKLKEVLKRKDIIDAANAKALEKVLSAQPVWTDVGLAKDIIPGFTENTIAHAGPPVSWENMCGPMQGSVIGALIYEGKAANEATVK